jgi:flagellar motility protein MotE (MotC chaperone)
MSLEDT